MNVLFLCPHGAAKSVMARALFEREARARGLLARADNAGTEPDAGPMPQVVALLAGEGIDVAALVPRRVSPEDLATAQRVVSLGCDLGELARYARALQSWDDVPLPSRDLAGARRIIGERVSGLVDELASESSTT